MLTNATPVTENSGSITTQDGTRLFSKDCGSCQPVVFSHGWPLNADAWDDQLDFVATNGYRAMVHDPERCRSRRDRFDRRGDKAMRRTLILPVIFALGIALALLGALAPRLAAQGSTPLAGAAAVTPIDVAPGVTAEVFAAAPSARAEGQTVYLARFTLQPGAEVFPHTHPGTEVLGVDSGTLGWTLVKGTAHVVRGAGVGATEVEDVTKPGTEVMLNPGDAIYYEDDVVHTARGASDKPTVVLGTLVLSSGQPLFMPATMELGAIPSYSAGHQTMLRAR
jgi:quercetin dioxygenase-like cupin family protein